MDNLTGYPFYFSPESITKQIIYTPKKLKFDAGIQTLNGGTQISPAQRTQVIKLVEDQQKNLSNENIYSDSNTFDFLFNELFECKICL